MEGENANKESNWSEEEIKSEKFFKCQLCRDCLGARPKTVKQKQYGDYYEMTYRTKRTLARISQQNLAQNYYYQNNF